MAEEREGNYYFGDYGKLVRLKVTTKDDKTLRQALAEVVFKEGADHLQKAPDGTVWGIDVRYRSNRPNEKHLMHLKDGIVEDYLLKSPVLRGTPKFGVDKQGRVLVADHGLWLYDPR